MQIIDLHCDTILHLVDDKSIHLCQNGLGVDIQKLKRANSVAQFFALFVDLQEHPDALARALQMVDVFYRELEENSQDIAIARNYAELTANQASGKISTFLTLEEGGAIAGSLENLRNFYRLGVRLITLTWNYPNEIGYPHIDPAFTKQGLTEFGLQVVTEMNRLGMLIDVSHLSDQGFYDVARVSSKPFVASHSNARAVCSHSRNVTDEMIQVLGEKGGVMGLNFAAHFLGHPTTSRVEDMVRHIKHVVNLGGIEVLALGSDLDGIEDQLEISDIGQIDKLTTALRQEGFHESEIEKIYFTNAVRVIKENL